jgi:hypothetical protein
MRHSNLEVKPTGREIILILQERTPVGAFRPSSPGLRNPTDPNRLDSA